LQGRNKAMSCSVGTKQGDENGNARMETTNGNAK